MAVLPMATNQ